MPRNGVQGGGDREGMKYLEVVFNRENNEAI